MASGGESSYRDTLQSDLVLFEHAFCMGVGAGRKI